MSDNATTQDQNDQQGNEAGNDAEVTSSPPTPRRRPRRATRPVMTPEERAAAEARAAAEQAPPGQQDATVQQGEQDPPAEPQARQTSAESQDQQGLNAQPEDALAQEGEQRAPAAQVNASPAEAGIDVLAEFGVDRMALDTAERAPAEPQAELNLDIPERGRSEGVEPEEHGSGAVNTDDDGDEHVVTGEPDPVARAQDEEPASADHDEEASDDGAQEAAEAPRLPATALLFQAPDPIAARTSRRAGAPAGPPAPAEGQDTGDGPDATGSDKDKDQNQGAEDGDGRSGGRRRRRGGRGRRRGGQGGQGAANSDGSDGKDSPDGDQDASGSGGDPDGQEASGSGGSGNDRKSGSGRSAKGGGKGAKGGSKDSNAGTKDTAKNDTSGQRGQNGESGEQQDTEAQGDKDQNGNGGGESNGSSRRRRRRRSRGSRSGGSDDSGRNARDEVTALKGSTRLEAKRQRRRDGRDSQRRRSIITEAEFLARRESVNRSMVVREKEGRTQVAILEDDVLVEHYVARKSQTSMVGNVYLGRVQNVLPSMEAAFIDVGKGRNAVLYAGEVNWDAAGLDGQPRRIEQALASGDSVLVQVTKDPVGHKGARLTSQITLAGRYLVLVPSGTMTGISRKLPDTERNRLKKLLKEIVPDGQGVIVRTAAEGASEDELRRDVDRLTKQWADIEKKTGRKSTNAPTLLKGEPELATRVVRDVFNEDFTSLTVSGGEAWKTISEYVGAVAPDLSERLHHWTAEKDVFAEHRIDEQLAKGLDRKVWLPSGGSLVIDRTEAMTVVDVNTGKFTGSGGTLEETVTRNNLEAAEEIVRQLRLRDIGGIIVIDFIDMVLEANRDLVLRRLVECLGRDRTRHQVAEVTSLGLVQMTRKRVGQGLLEAFSETCEHCSGRGFHVHSEPVGAGDNNGSADSGRSSRRGSGKNRSEKNNAAPSRVVEPEEDPEQRAAVRATLATIAAAAANAHSDEEKEEGKAEEAKPAGEAKPAEEAKPAGEDEHAEQAEPAEAARPGEEAQPTQEPQPAEDEETKADATGSGAGGKDQADAVQPAAEH